MANDVPVAQPTNREEIDWAEEAARLAYVAIRALIAYAWVSRCHPPGTNMLTGWWLVCWLQLTSSRHINGLLAAYTWPTIRLLVTLAWSVGVVFVNVIQNVAITTIAGCVVGVYAYVKTWQADNILESDRYVTNLNGAI